MLFDSRYRRPPLGVSSLDWAAHYRAAFFLGKLPFARWMTRILRSSCCVRAGAELPIDATDQAYENGRIRVT